MLVDWGLSSLESYLNSLSLLHLDSHPRDTLIPDLLLGFHSVSRKLEIVWDIVLVFYSGL